MASSSVCVWLLLSVVVTGGQAGRILIFPLAYGSGSHMMDALQFSSILQQRGHAISFLINHRDAARVSHQNVTVYDYPVPRDIVGGKTEAASAQLTTSRHKGTDLKQIWRFIAEQKSYCEQLLRSEVLSVLKQQQFDLLFVDFADSCSRIVTYYLDIPTVMFNGMGLNYEATFFPNLPSFVPLPMSASPSLMGFWGRVTNTLKYWIMKAFISPHIYGTFDDLKNQFGMNQSLFVANAFVDKMVVAHCNFAPDYPRPLPPNVVCVGGMHIAPPKPLEGRIADFLWDADDTGFIVVSFGHLVSRLAPEQTEALARGLARLPQKVIWRYRGEVPEGLGNNTLLVEWLPQNDLLAQARAFLSHCGIRSVYETIHHGVPVLALPLFMDQFEQANKLVNRLGMGRLIDLRDLHEDLVYSELTIVLNDVRYTENARRASLVFRDHPVPLTEKFIYSVEYQMRHHGSQHLVIEPLKHLNVWQLYSVDVALLVAGAALLMVVGMYMALRRLLPWFMHHCKHVYIYSIQYICWYLLKPCPQSKWVNPWCVLSLPYQYYCL